MAGVCGSSSRHLMSIWLILFLQYLAIYSSVAFQVLGPAHPVTAVLGEDLVLPCFLQPNINAEGMTVEWVRLNQQHQEQHGSLVHLYRDRRDQNDKQIQSYRGRTSLFTDELNKGNASLKLSKVQVSDEGDYKCLVQSGSDYDDVSVQVIVKGIGQAPLITPKGIREDDRMTLDTLVCKADGWWPEPVLEWLDSHGRLISAEETKKHLGQNGFTVEKWLVAYKRNTDYYVCRLRQEDDRMTSLREVVMESKCNISDLKSRQPWYIPFVVSVTFLSVFICCWCCSGCCYICNKPNSQASSVC